VGGIRALGEGGKLVDEPEYERSREAAGVGDDEEVVLWVDLDQAADLVTQVGDLSGQDLPPNVAANLQPLRSLLVAGSYQGDDSTFRLFVEVE
jgi:hypothetical protein